LIYPAIKWVEFPVRYVNVYQRVCHGTSDFSMHDLYVFNGDFMGTVMDSDGGSMGVIPK
jgi:precorrin isomerase